MSKAPKDHRVPIMMSAYEVETIDAWRFENKIATRAEAVRRLCQIGLATEAWMEMNIDLVGEPVNTEDLPKLFAILRKLRLLNSLLAFAKRRGGDIINVAEAWESSEWILEDPSNSQPETKE